MAVHQGSPPCSLSLLDEVHSRLEVLVDGLTLSVLQRDASPPATSGQALLYMLAKLLLPSA